jgi:hypothetical protein
MTNRRPLNNKQLHLLKLIYKFRFVTTDLLLKRDIAKSNAVIHGRLKVLLDQEYIGRNYDSSYRLQNKHAVYYILPKGIKILKEEGLDEAALRNMYKDKTASERFIEHCLQVFLIYCQLRRLYHKDVDIYSRSELGQQEDFPKPCPDLYLSGKQDYFLEYIDSSTPFFAVRRMINRYIEHEESGEWEGEYPTLLFVCGSAAQGTRVLKYLDQIGESSDLQFRVTTIKALRLAQDKKDPVWSDSTAPEKSVSLG